jgi:glycosyltransferase involved in cell wall biosynthesis
MSSEIKVLHIISAPAAGGAEMLVKDLAKEMTSHGVQSHIGFVCDDPVDRDEFATNFLRELRVLAIPYFFVGERARRRPWSGIARVRRYVRQSGIDIYHAHLTFGIVFGAFLSIPRVYTHHNIRMRVGKFSFRFLGQFVEVFIGISEICSKVLREHAGRQVTTICNGVDADKVVTRTRQAFDNVRELSCLSVGTICPQKDYENLCGALSLLPQTMRSRIRVRICGGGKESDIVSLRETVERLRLGMSVELLGKRSDVQKLMADSDLFLMSSAYEGMPIALIEATMTGLPCIVTDVGGCKEIIDRCGNGIVVPPRDSAAFAGALHRLFEDAGLRACMSTSAIQASGFYSISTTAAAYDAVYRKCLSEKDMNR